MVFFKPRMVEVRDRGYAMIDGFEDSTNEDFFNNVELPLDQPEKLGELEGRTQLQFFKEVMRR